MSTQSLDTNLLQSAKKTKSEGEPESPGVLRKKKILKALSYFVFFFISLVFFTVLKIPDSAIANFLLNYANTNSASYSFQAEKVSFRFFPYPHLEVDKLGMEPRFPGAGLPLTFDQVRVYPNPLLGLGINFSADAYKSTLTGAVSMSSFKLAGENLDLGKLTPLAQAGLDIKGLISTLYVEVATQNQRIATASGDIRIQGINFIFDATSFGLPVVLPILNLGDLEVQGTASQGQVRLEKFKVGSPGKDLELQIASGTIMLSDVIINTRYDLHVLIKPSATLEKAVPLLPSMLSSMATKRADGFFGIKLAGTLAGVPSIKKE